MVTFAKILTPADANNDGGFSVRRYCVDFVFPPLDFHVESSGTEALHHRYPLRRLGLPLHLPQYTEAALINHRMEQVHQQQEAYRWRLHGFHEEIY